MNRGTGLTYAVVSPVRDEAEYLPITARCLVEQTRRPERWVIVDDGSADATGDIADTLAAEHSWISVVHRPRRRTRERGGPIVEAFDAGRAALDVDVDVVVKLDGDLHFASHYFAWVMQVFERDPRAGVVGGVAHVFDGQRWRVDTVREDNVNGVAKAYRVACLQSIGGLQRAMGWDGIDEYAARARGWNVVPLSELVILHYKLRGSKQRWWRSRWEEGRGMHFMGYGLEGLALRVGFRSLVERPQVLSGVVMLAGYLASLVQQAPRVADPDAIGLLRAEHRRRLLGLLRGRTGRQSTDVRQEGPARALVAQLRETSAAAAEPVAGPGEGDLIPARSTPLLP